MYKNYYEVTKLDNSEEWPNERDLVVLCDGRQKAQGFIKRCISQTVRLIDVYLKENPELTPREVEATTNV